LRGQPQFAFLQQQARLGSGSVSRVSIRGDALDHFAVGFGHDLERSFAFAAAGRCSA